MGLMAYLSTTTILRDGNYGALFPIPLRDTRAENRELIRSKFIEAGMSPETADRTIDQMERKQLSALELIGIRSLIPDVPLIAEGLHGPDSVAH